MGRKGVLLAIHFLVVLLAFTAGWFLGPGRAPAEVVPRVGLERYRPLVYLVAEDYARTGDISLGRAVFAGWDHFLLTRELTLVEEQEEDSATRARLLALREGLALAGDGSGALITTNTDVRQIAESLLQNRTVFWSVMAVAAVVVAMFATATFFALRLLLRQQQVDSGDLDGPVRGLESDLRGDIGGAKRAVQAPELPIRPAQTGREMGAQESDVRPDLMAPVAASRVQPNEHALSVEELQMPEMPQQEPEIHESIPLDAHTLVGELPEISILEIAQTSHWILARMREQNKASRTAVG